MSKPRVVKDYEKVDPAIIHEIKRHYPYGFDKHLISFKNPKGKFVSALPYETEDRYYLIRMTREEAIAIIKADDDFDASGKLKVEPVEEEADPVEAVEELDAEELDTEDMPAEEIIDETVDPEDD
ncbi:MAG: hypothetical protein AAFQ02_02325 [Bacteroidota bacterium]